MQTSASMAPLAAWEPHRAGFGETMLVEVQDSVSLEAGRDLGLQVDASESWAPGKCKNQILSAMSACHGDSSKGDDMPVNAQGVCAYDEMRMAG